MPDPVSLRYRYTQFFVLFILGSLSFVMMASTGSGINKFEDNLYKKNFLIQKANLLQEKIGNRILPISLVGKDGWVDYTGDGNIDDFQNLKPFEHKRQLFVKIKSLHEYFKSRGITLLIVVAPNKATIYPDKLPEQIKSLPIPSRLDELMAYSKRAHLPDIVDLRPSLRAARASQDVYFKVNNTHWNGYGAFVAYTATMKALESSYPELKPYQAADLQWVPNKDPYLTLPDFYFAPKTPFVQTLHLSPDHGRFQFLGIEYGYNQFSSIPDSRLPTLLMFHDSFGTYYLNDYISMNFGKSYFVHIAGSAPYATKEALQKFDPDIIIIEIVERDLNLLSNVLENFQDH